MLFCIGVSFGQVNFRHLTTENGLSDNIIVCILRDSKGFLWIGTQNGLNRFDGYNNTVFRNDIKDPFSSGGNFITDIIEDYEGSIWVSTSNGLLDRYEYSSNRFYRCNLIPDSTSTISLIIKDLFIDLDSNLWVAVLNTGLFLYSKSDKSFKQFRAENKQGSISSDLVSSITQDNKGRIWILTNDGFINKYDPASQSFEKVLYTDKFIGNPLDLHSGKLYSDSQGRIWIGTHKMGFYIFDPDKNTFRHYLNHNTSNSLSNNTVTGIAELDENNFWICTDHGGLNLFNVQQEFFTHYINNPCDLLSISNDQIYSIYKDYDNIFWVGNYLGGVNYFKYSKGIFDNYTTTEDGKGLSNSVVLCILERTNGEIWIGTDGGGINILHPEGNTYRLINNPSINKRISGKIITSLLEDKKGRVWIGTYLEGLNRYNPKTDEVKVYFDSQEKSPQFSNISVWYLLEDSKNRIWVGTLSSGLMLYNEQHDTYYQFPSDLNGSTSTSGKAIISIFEDNKKRIWIAPAGAGLDLFNDEDSTFANFRHLNNNDNLRSAQGVICIYEDSNGILWLGTFGGIDQFDPKTKTYKSLANENGLPNSPVQGILEDNHGILWISTTNGLYKHNLSKKNTKRLSKINGLQDSRFNYKANIKTHNGKLFFGSINGITSFYPDSLNLKSNPPPVVINEFRLYNEKVNIGNHSPLKESILTTSEILLHHYQNFLSFGYTALEYLRQNETNYAYYMEGLEKKWNMVGTLRTAAYTDLKPGKYIFHVKAISINDDSESNIASIKIIIKPPFWQTWWFKIIAIVLFFSSLYLLYVVRVNMLRKQKVQLEKMVDEKTIELSEKNALLLEQAQELNETNSLLEEQANQIEEQSEELRAQKDELTIRAEELSKINAKLAELNRLKDRFFSIIAHDLKNPFNTIIGFSELLKVKKHALTEEKEDRYINAIYSTSRNVYNLLENLLLWSRSQSERIQFNPEIFQIKGIIEANILLQRENIKAKNISVKVEVPDEFSVYADSNMFDTVIRNLLSNAIKFTPDNGTIKITSTSSNTKSVISVSDSGIGIPENAMHDLFRIDHAISTDGTKGEKGTGLGLILCKEFIDKHKGEIAVNSEVGKGSTFIITLPFHDKI